MNMNEAERLISQWRLSKRRLKALSRLENSKEIIVSDGSMETINLEPNEMRILLVMLDNTIREREQNLRERIAKELNIDIED